MTAFEDINAADFDIGDDTIDDLILTGSWYNNAGELDLNAIQSLREQTIKQSEISNSHTLSESLDFNASSELAKGLIALSSFENRPRILDLKGTHARILLDAIQTWLDTSKPEHPFRRRLLYLLIKLAAASQQLPTHIFLDGVDLGDARDPWRIGGFADIFRGQYRSQLVVGKRLRLQNLDKQVVHKALCREALVWHQLKHPAIMPLLGVDAMTFASSGSLCLVSPLMKCSLSEHLKSPDYVPPRDLFRLILTISSGLAYLHSLKVVHGDINLANILLTEEGTAQLADFGLSIVGEGTLGNMTADSGNKGTTRWESPERLKGDMDRIRSTDDVYAFACICYALFSFKVPFHDVQEPAVPFKVIKGIRPSRKECENCPGVPMTDQTWSLIDACWSQEPASRPTIFEAQRRITELSQNHLYSTVDADSVSEHMRFDLDVRLSSPSPLDENINGSNFKSIHEDNEREKTWRGSLWAIWPRHAVVDPFALEAVELRLEIGMNPLLESQLHSSSRAILNWNMLQPSSSCYILSDDPQYPPWAEGRNHPATFPRLTSLRIVSQYFPWAIRINTADKTIGVTCGEVIDGIDHFLREMISRRVFEGEHHQRKKDIASAYHLNRSMDQHGVPRTNLGEGLRRLDWLRENTMYGGIKANSHFVHVEHGGFPAILELYCKNPNQTPGEEEAMEWRGFGRKSPASKMTLSGPSKYTPRLETLPIELPPEFQPEDLKLRRFASIGQDRLQTELPRTPHVPLAENLVLI